LKQVKKKVGREDNSMTGRIVEYGAGRRGREQGVVSEA
jgi:hypothetical protein